MSEVFEVSCPHAVLTVAALSTDDEVRPVAVGLQVRRSSDQPEFEVKTRHIEERLDLFRLSRVRRLVESPAIWTIVDVTHKADMFWSLASPAVAVMLREWGGQITGVAFLGVIMVDYDELCQMAMANRLRSHDCVDEYQAIMYETGIVLDDLVDWALANAVEIDLGLLQTCVADGLVALTPAVSRLGIVDADAWQIRRVELGLATEKLKSQLQVLLSNMTRDERLVLGGDHADLIHKVGTEFAINACLYMPDMCAGERSLSAMMIVTQAICQRSGGTCFCQRCREWLATTGADLMGVPRRPDHVDELIKNAVKLWHD